MKKLQTLFLQAGIIVLGLGVLVALLWEPHLEGRNTHATPFEIYFHDPFLAYVYIASIPFFIGLYQAFQILVYIGQNNMLSQATVKAVRTIKYCAVITAGAIVFASILLMITAQSSNDDAAGAVMLGLIATLAALMIAAAAAVFEGALQNAIETKSQPIK